MFIRNEKARIRFGFFLFCFLFPLRVPFRHVLGLLFGNACEMWVVFALHRDMHVKRRVFGDDSFELLLGHACEIRVKLGVFVVVALRKCFCGGATSFLSPMAFSDFLIYTIHYIQYI